MVIGASPAARRSAPARWRLEFGYWRLQLFSQELVCFRRENEIAFGQPVDLMGPDRQFDFSPGEVDVRMVALGLRQFSHSVRKLQGFAKVFEFIFLLQMVLVFDSPTTTQLLRKSFELMPFQG